MKILYVAYRYDYGRPERGLSFEHYNFFEALQHLGHDVTYFDIAEYLQGTEPGAADDGLRRVARGGSFDLVFFFLYQEEISPAVIAELTATGVPTLNWFADDHWRFEDYTSRYAGSFSWVTTTALSALPKYRALGISNVIRTQWGAATNRYRPTQGPPQHDVTFVGQVYGERPAMVSAMRAAGLGVQTWGTGWAAQRWHRAVGHRRGLRTLGGRALLRRVEASTRCDQDEMIRIFGTTRINVNFTEASQGAEAQIKGRTFEVPACGGFLLTGRSAHLEEYLEPDREVVVFASTDELVDKARYYLSHDDERRAIAEAGLRRTLAEHTYGHRFQQIFAAMGLSA